MPANIDYVGIKSSSTVIMNFAFYTIGSILKWIPMTGSIHVQFRLVFWACYIRLFFKNTTQEQFYLGCGDNRYLDTAFLHILHANELMHTIHKL